MSKQNSSPQKASNVLDGFLKNFHCNGKNTQGRVKSEMVKFRADAQGVEIQRLRYFETPGESKTMSITENYKLDGPSTSKAAQYALANFDGRFGGAQMQQQEMVSYKNNNNGKRYRGHPQRRYMKRGHGSNFNNSYNNNDGAFEYDYNHDDPYDCVSDMCCGYISDA